MDWPAGLSHGIALAGGGDRLRCCLAGFLLARAVDDEGHYRDTSGARRRLGSALRSLGRRHHHVASAAVTAGPGTVLVPSDALRFGRPALGRLVYLTGCPVEIPGAVQNRLLREPERFLTGIARIGRDAPDPGLAADPALVAWIFWRAGAPNVGFARAAFLDRIGIAYCPMDELAVAADAAPGRSDPLPPPRDRAFARIKAYRGEPGFIGVHEYYVRCPACRAPGDFPANLFVERFVRYRCAACTHVFHAEALRSNLSLRSHGH